MEGQASGSIASNLLSASIYLAIGTAPWSALLHCETRLHDTRFTMNSQRWVAASAAAAIAVTSLLSSDGSDNLETWHELPAAKQLALHLRAGTRLLGRGHVELGLDEWRRCISVVTQGDAEAMATQVSCASRALIALHNLDRNVEAQRLGEEAHRLGILMHPAQAPEHLLRGVASAPWWTEAACGEACRMLRANFRPIREEVAAFMAGHEEEGLGAHGMEQERLATAGRWSEVRLHSNGQRNATSASRLPFIASLVARLPGAEAMPMGSVKVSVLHPGTRIRPHFGPTNLRLRLHLGLIVAQPALAALVVAGEARQWREGELLAFDDSFAHEVWHNGSSPRVVLVVDVWHPSLSERQRADGIRSAPAWARDAAAAIRRGSDSL